MSASSGTNKESSQGGEIPSNAFVFPLSAISLEKFDIGGVLYHANYFHLLEQSREALLANSGIPYPQLVAEKQHLAIVESHQQFLLPITYGQPINMAVWCSNLSRSTCTLKYVLMRDSDSELVHLASTKLVFVSVLPNSSGDFKVTKFTEKLSTAFQKIHANT